MKEGILKNDPEILRRLVQKCFPQHENVVEHLISVKSEIMENAKSFWSLIAKISLEWRPEFGVQRPPRSLIIKFPVLTDNVMAAGMPLGIDHLKKELLELTEREVTFYEKLNNDKIPYFPLPRFYYGEIMDEAEDRGILVLEDVGTSTFAASHIPGLTLEQVELLMDALAGLHHYSITSDKKWNEHPRFKQGVIDEGFQVEQYETVRRLEEICPKRFKGKIEKIKEHFDYKKGVAAEQSFTDLEMPPVLCHADLNVTNILWDAHGTTEHPKLHAIIDFQRFHLGNACEDIARILMLTISAEERRRNTERLLRRYHDTLTKLFNGRPPYPIEKVEEAYVEIFPYASNFVLFGVIVYYDMYETLEPNEAKRREIREELLSRAEGIVDDLVDLLDPL